MQSKLCVCDEVHVGGCEQAPERCYLVDYKKSFHDVYVYQIMILYISDIHKSYLKAKIKKRRPNE